ncbi:hypothetical protein KDK_57890 [Dictyobacter kobayashii]|uniref:Uncharacterized protein n=1 Tax=Dictyobacter kobayashii TaxID=2014872 RepID=A0A402ASB3_9CHLR|nr:hypothetical protein KDK_57890 [Dictyobacter kobayashii]
MRKLNDHFFRGDLGRSREEEKKRVGEDGGRLTQEKERSKSEENIKPNTHGIDCVCPLVELFDR